MFQFDHVKRQKMLSKQIGIFLALAILSTCNGDCPCSVKSGALTCKPGIIYDFPEDVFKVIFWYLPICLMSVHEFP